MMKSCRKSILYRKGFTMIEVLISLFALSIAILLLSYGVNIMKVISSSSYVNEDQIAIYQLRTLLAQSHHIQVEQNQLMFQYAHENAFLAFHNHRLVKRRGYEIFLKDIDKAEFTTQGGCIYVYWMREQKIKKAMLTCE